MSPHNQFQRRWQQRLSRGLLAIAIMASLTIYQQQTSAHPDAIAQRHWQAISILNKTQVLKTYRADAVVLWSNGLTVRRYDGQTLERAWQDTLQNYTVQSYTITAVSDRWIEADVILSPRHAAWAANDRLVMVYNAELDANGKIIQEVWKSQVKFNV